MLVEIMRIEDSEEGVFGVLLINKEIFCVTLEPPELDNLKNKSCIPEGVYCCRYKRSPKYGGTFEVADVPGRSGILFHAGNIKEHTRGCILLGETFGKLKGDRAILNSGKTFTKFMSRVKMAFALHIKKCY